MAKFLGAIPGGEIRGSIGSTTFSRNHYGAYMRKRSKPKECVSEECAGAKVRMTNATQAWQGLAVADQDAWRMWARANPVKGSIGDVNYLTGHAAFVGIYCRHTLCGAATLTSPPLTPAPPGLTSCSVVADKTAGTANLTFKATPIGPGNNIWYYGCYVASAGKRWVENLLLWCSLTAAAANSPVDLFAGIEARLGAMTIGHRLILNVHVFDNDTGLLSTPMRCEDTIV